MIQDAVLGLLAREPSHGYALWQTLQSWSADPESVQSSSVYMALKRLSDAGAIEVIGPAPTHGSGERPRFTFGLTEVGRDRVDKWLAHPPASTEELRLRIALAQPLDDLSALIEWVVAALAQTQKRLGSSPADRRHIDAWDAASAMALSALEFRELSARAQWLAEAHAQLQTLHILASEYQRP
ncbi:MAG TPA: PadR family transcriptional regulator [Baekduia sp.]|uniref:PadR family transcriptional regulator n=1 Tax=Baekduia sp. TaxID=2600305 RepID=UPI002B6A1B44|nr:PadR family transcriptional regulator [Baekduia sp.]HMJ34993.1 PadR family transcriptional regulator [Baekduia sp.]